MGESEATTTSPGRGRGRQPRLLGPWLATGLGLFALNATPELSATEPAYAAGPSSHAAIAAPDVGSSLASLMATSQQLAVPAPATPVASAASALSTTALAPAAATYGALAGPLDRIAGVTFGQPLPQPRTTDAITIANRSDKSMNERWAELRHCEARSNYEIVNFSGKYRGAYQFDQATWESVGGSGDPAAADPIEQDKRARILYERRGSAPWPECGRHLE